MKCENEGCEVQMDEPQLSIYVADARGDSSNAFWGHYCSPTCSLTDIGMTLMAVIEQEDPVESLGTTINFAIDIDDGLDGQVTPISMTALGAINLWQMAAIFTEEQAKEISQAIPSLAILGTGLFSHTEPELEGKEVKRFAADLLVTTATGQLHYVLTHNKTAVVLTGIPNSDTEDVHTLWELSQWNAGTQMNLINAIKLHAEVKHGVFVAVNASESGDDTF